jgi:hypothetical protein
LFYNGAGLNGNFNVCKMFSDDGVHWSESGLNPIQAFDSMTTCTPYVEWTGDSTYQLWYGYGPTTFLAFSVYRQNFIRQKESVLTIAASSKALVSMDAAEAVDNNPSTFWSSAGHTTATNTEWLYLNFGAKSKISQVTMLPRDVSGAPMCFPANFKFQSSINGSSWTDIDGQTYTNYLCADTLTQKFTFSSPVTAQYLRLYVTKLNKDSFGNYYCQIAEISVSKTTSVKDGNSNLPKEFSLSQNYPNPFNPSTEIQYSIPKNGMVTLQIYNLLGQVVSTLVNREQKAGSYTVNFDASNLPAGRQGLASGIYMYRIQSGSFSLTKKMTLLK